MVTMPRPVTQTTADQRLAVAQILVGREFGGAERYVLDLAGRLQGRGHQVTFILPPDSVLRDPLDELGITVAWEWIRSDINFQSPFLVAHAVRQLEAELLNIHDNGAAVPCALGGRMAHVPVVGTVHGRHSRWAFSAADHLITVSDALRTHLIEQGMRGERITTVRTGVDTTFFTPQPQGAARAALGLEPDAFYFAAIGRLAEGKGLEMLLAAFHALAPTHPRLRLLFVGTGPLEDGLRERTTELGLRDIVTFCGFSDDVRGPLAAADCLVLPSESEGMPLIVLEAMACGRAVIGTTVGGIPEVVCDGDTGFLLAPRDYDGLLAAMTRLVDSTELAGTLGAAARACAESTHTVELQIAGIEAVYRRMLALA
jgi:glycosyltransferase involved in cell wall biosynthesis